MRWELCIGTMQKKLCNSFFVWSCWFVGPLRSSWTLTLYEVQNALLPAQIREWLHAAVGPTAPDVEDQPKGPTFPNMEVGLNEGNSTLSLIHYIHCIQRFIHSSLIWWLWFAKSMSSHVANKTKKCSLPSSLSFAKSLLEKMLSMYDRVRRIMSFIVDVIMICSCMFMNCCKGKSFCSKCSIRL